ncbi:MAG: histidine kinase [Flavobacteriales bacterium]|nr:histidine kinase [Flavobacteriales bacterium]
MKRLTLFILLLTPFFTWAQHPSYWVLNHEQGLPSLKVYDLMEDSLDVVWAGTSEGLVHYDGLWLQTLRTETARSQDRSMLQMGPNGQVWSMNFAGELFLSSYESMEQHQIPEDLPTSKVSYLERIGDELFFMTRNEILKSDLLGNDFSLLRKAAENTSFYGLAAPNFALTAKGLIDLPSGNRLAEKEEAASTLCSSNGKIYQYYYITGTVLGLNAEGSDTIVKNLRRSEGPTPLITGVRNTSAGTWILTYDGAYLVESASWLFPSTPVSDVIETKDGAHWFSTLTDGIAVVPDLGLQRYGKEPDALPTQRFNRVRKLPNGNVVATDNNGMALLIHPEKGLLASFKSEFTRESEVLAIDTVNNRILAAFGDLYLLDGNTLKQLDKFSGNVKSITLWGGNISIVDATNLYAFTYDGNRFGDKLDVFDVEQAVYQNAIDRDGRQWLLTATGALVNGSAFVVPNSTTTFRPSLMATAADGRVYLTNRKDSIAVADNGAFNHWLAIPGIMRQSGTIRSIYASPSHLFVLLSNALLIHDLKTENWQRIGQSEGLPSTDLKDVVADNNRAWLATFNGLYSIPLSQNEIQLSPTVQLRTLKVNGQVIPLSPNLELQHNQNDIELILRGISTKSRGRIQFAYKLNGLMNDFEVNENGAVIRFRALAPGSYNLEVFALDVNGIPSEKHLQLSFVIQKPWYATWPFLLLVALVLVATVSTVFLFRIRYINNRNSQELERSRLMEDLRASQMTALRAQMNPHFMFNVLNSIQGLFTIGKTEKANEVMSRFSDLMRSILDVRDQNTIGLDKELEMIGLYLELEAVRFGDEFTYQLKVDADIDPKKVEVPSLLIQPYVENAVKHGLLHRKGNKNLSVSLVLMENATMLEVRIDDNGIGREKAGELRSEKHKSFATQATSSRLDLLNVENAHKIGVEIIDKKDGAGNANGTLVILRIPLTAKVS